jgi:hypothetical protein
MSGSSPDRERVREQFRPAEVELLLIGEAPPASGRFFYNRDSGLYRAVRDVFIEYDSSIEETNFLHRFMVLGCYLVDLCGRPVDRVEAHERQQASKAGENHLASVLQELRPPTIVSLVRATEPHVAASVRLAYWTGRQVALPYPGRWHKYRQVFRVELLALLHSIDLSRKRYP